MQHTREAAKIFKDLGTPAPVVFVAFYCAGLLAGALEINLNVEIGKEEAGIGRSIMNRAQGFGSLGFFVTALCASFVRQIGMSMHLHVGLAFGVVLIAGGWVISRLRDTPSAIAAKLEKAKHFAFPTMGLLQLCIIAAFLVDGAGIAWSAIYMRDVFAVEPFIGGLGLTLFTFFMAMVRLFVDPLVDRYGARLVCIALLVLSAAGLIAVWLAPHSYVALMGGGCSAVYPLTVSAAAQRTDRSAHLDIAALGQVTFIVFFLAPPLLGFVAEHFGIRNSYFICLPFVIGALLSVKALAEKKCSLVSTITPFMVPSRIPTDDSK